MSKVETSNTTVYNTASENRRSDRRFWDIGIMLTLVLMAAYVRGCDFNGSRASVPPGLVNTSQIAENTDDFLGKTVTIKSKPIQKIGLSSFTVNDNRENRDKSDNSNNSDRSSAETEPIVIVNASGVPFNIPSDRNTEVQVTGQVRNLDIPTIERDFKINLQDQYYTDYINKPAIVAQHIAIAPKPGQITQNARKFYGKEVAVQGEVGNIQSPVLFTLNKEQLIGGEDLPVLLKTAPTVAINQGQKVAVVGEVRQFVANEIERDFNLTWDSNVKRQMEAQYNKKPVLIATEVYP
ncbi:MAG: hypothetical protein ACHBN1_05700 [Heteroscytonema crispum UTEX LB 1556]